LNDSGTPESFNVLVKEIQSLGLDIKLNKRDALGNLTAARTTSAASGPIPRVSNL
jgi:DNA-directed RNA polymerase subunit beta